MSRRCNNKWTTEEEDAFRNGINKHGVGKWQTIIDDPEFSTILVHRTNVSLKDKWRTMNNVAKGKSRISYKRVQKKPSRYYNKYAAFTGEGSGKNETAQHDTPAIIYESSEDDGLEKLTSRFADYKLDSLTNAKKPSSYMLKQEQLPSPNLKRFLCGNSISIAANGKPNEVEQEMEYDLADLDRAVKAAVDAEVMRLRHMTPEDAAAAAAAAVENAQATLVEAEEAVLEAEEAERIAEEKISVAEELERKFEEMKAKAAPKNGKRGRST